MDLLDVHYTNWSDFLLLVQAYISRHFSTYQYMYNNLKTSMEKPG